MNWISFVKDYQSKNNISFKKAMKEAAPSYRKMKESKGEPKKVIKIIKDKKKPVKKIKIIKDKKEPVKKKVIKIIKDKKEPVKNENEKDVNCQSFKNQSESLIHFYTTAKGVISKSHFKGESKKYINNLVERLKSYKDDKRCSKATLEKINKVLELQKKAKTPAPAPAKKAETEKLKKQLKNKKYDFNFMKKIKFSNNSSENNRATENALRKNFTKMEIKKMCDVIYRNKNSKEFFKMTKNLEDEKFEDIVTSNILDMCVEDDFEEKENKKR